MNPDVPDMEAKTHSTRTRWREGLEQRPLCCPPALLMLPEKAGSPHQEEDRKSQGPRSLSSFIHPARMCQAGSCCVSVCVAAHASILAWEIPWTEEPGGLHSTESQRVGHGWVTEKQQQSFHPYSVDLASFISEMGRHISTDHPARKGRAGIQT